MAAATLLKRLPLVLSRFGLDLLPVIAFLLAGHVVAASPLSGSDQTRLIILAMIDAYAICGTIMCFSRMMLSPQRKRLRLLRLSDDNAQWATRWIRRIAVVAVFGYAIAEVGLLLGMSGLAHDGLLKAAGLIVHLSLVVMVLQKRRAVARLLRAPPGATGMSARIRNAVAPVWHWIAIFFLIGIWIVAAAEIRNGAAVVLRYFVEIVLVATIARLLLIVLLGSLDRSMRPRPELLERYPGLEQRLAAYHPLLHGIARTIVYCAAAFVLLELWGVPLAAWFAVSLLGRRLIASLGTMVLTLLLALAVWEVSNAAIELHLSRLTHAQQLPRATRLRTLVPLLRTTLLVVILVIAGLTVLSEIGFNIAPLLAGAGIIGVAIGFGSQKLVQDLITGIFLLLENAMQVGDWVTVSGLSGSVENLSVRTIRLRAGDGSVHI
ncbi:MAG: mechanosensitive ion channel domain-containing protein, partial [Acetobacteraceae bacterium]